MAIISLGTLDKKLIPILIGAVFSIFNKLLIKYPDTNIFKHKIIANIVSIFSKTFTVVPYLIIKCKSRKIQYNEIENRINREDLIFNDKYDKQTEGKWNLIIITTLFFFVQAILVLYSLEIKFNSWILEILLTSILYYKIFNLNLYKHHYISIALIIITGIIIDVSFGNLQNDVTDNILPFLFRILREIFYSLHDVTNKYLMEKKYCTPYEISLYIGIFNLIYFGLFSLLSYYFLKVDDFYEYFNNFNNSELFALISLSIIQLGLSLSCLIINNNKTPCHIFIISVLGQFANYTDFSTYSIVLFICLIFLLFMSLVFTEIIEINICGLSYNTKRNISNRAEMANLLVGNNTTVSSANSNNDEENQNNTLNESSGNNTLEKQNDNEF